MQILKDYAMQLIGTPYRWGGDDPMQGFDCSGLVIELLQSCGELPRNYDNTAQGLYEEFIRRGVISRVGFGSLAFFGKSDRHITHVGFMLDNYRMIESGGGGSATVTIEIAAQQNAFVRIRPVKWRNDLVTIIRPRYNLTWKQDNF